MSVMSALTMLDLGGGRQVPLEDVAEGVPVGDLEPSQRGDVHVQVDRVEAFRNVLAAPADQHLVDGVDDRCVQRRMLCTSRECAAARLVLFRRPPARRTTDARGNSPA
jgi:hypothetical protein